MRAVPASTQLARNDIPFEGRYTSRTATLTVWSIPIETFGRFFSQVNSRIISARRTHYRLTIRDNLTSNAIRTPASERLVQASFVSLVGSSSRDAKERKKEKKRKNSLITIELLSCERATFSSYFLIDDTARRRHPLRSFQPSPSILENLRVEAHRRLRRRLREGRVYVSRLHQGRIP